MAEPSDHLVLALLRAIRNDVGDLKDGVREVKSRLGTLEKQYASLSLRLDRVDDRAAGIKRRCEVREPAASFYARAARDYGSDVDLEAVIRATR